MRHFTLGPEERNNDYAYQTDPIFKGRIDTGLLMSAYPSVSVCHFQ
jgi:hypothetical protein